ncbi:MAG: hypothetical protein CMQ41_12840 [Gammaproteobacteria bacterium]|nr:hypothetical protein [Gammaproteobacteria bacterium]|tara:strand:- start:35 stop:217 length:183 start_codon:yes stop_codon:yes gene_type:complete
MNIKRYFLEIVFLATILVGLQSCVSSVVDAVANVGIEVAKVPFKVVGATVDLVVPEDDED